MNNADAMKRRGFSFPPQVADIELLSKVVFLYKNVAKRNAQPDNNFRKLPGGIFNSSSDLTESS